MEGTPSESEPANLRRRRACMTQSTTVVHPSSPTGLAKRGDLLQPRPTEPEVRHGKACGELVDAKDKCGV